MKTCTVVSYQMLTSRFATNATRTNQQWMASNTYAFIQGTTDHAVSAQVLLHCLNYHSLIIELMKKLALIIGPNSEYLIKRRTGRAIKTGIIKHFVTIVLPAG